MSRDQIGIAPVTAGWLDGGVRGRWSDPVPRAIAVVALTAAGALTLRARSGLDWGQLSDPLDVRWSRLVLGAVLGAVVATVTVRLYRMIRKAGSTSMGSGDDEHAEPEGEPVPLWIRVLFTLCVLATMAAVFFVIASVQTPHPEQARHFRRLNEGRGGAAADPDTGTTWTVALIVAVGLLVCAVAWRWLEERRDRLSVQDDEGQQRAEIARLVEAVDAAEQELHDHADPRTAVLAAYAAMARHLSTGLVRRGRSEARSSDTATELLDRSVAAGLVSGGPAGTLTALFREARFSDHPMGPAARTDALDALAEVRDELAARHG